MDYLFENLGDERFQEFCSAILSKEFPNVQCFPVGQPDGGRDSIVFFMDTPKKEYFVFQVKFVRNALEERDLHKWLTEVVTGEVEKVRILSQHGAIRYYLLTNVRGTAHLDSGSKDKVNKILEDNLPIPAMCWWRDDLARRFEADPLFKWSFPEIIHGQDILNSVLFETLNENKERRATVITSYLADQYAAENEVKFKQIDLQNKLFSLFTDVPLRLKKISDRSRKLKRILSTTFHSNSTGEFFRPDEMPTMGASAFLLDSTIQNEVERVMLEGGPGQGKSTISQYVCQVHRSKLLGKSYEVSSLPNYAKHAAIRLPFKIDLRDLAAWVEGKNPYPETLSDEYFKTNWKGGLESFLVGHIYYHSNIQDYSSTDLVATLKVTPALLVFDGFDEIANIESRKKIIEFVDKGITRLSANAKSIQVLITSRPAAFSDSVVFATDKYPHFELTDVTTSTINEYVEKWIKASKLDTRAAHELKRTVTDKLMLPHLRELAKSPMQLAIFISLLRTKGQSLPNKRTALYDSYINLFFDRESEKSDLVRDHRILITDIHQYLAWILHSEAETLKNSGRIELDQLKIRLKEYLTREGHNPSIADELFDVMKERVCALVSRVQNTFEFEVQPLREYFCGKYLYCTAQNSTAGTIRTGTKPDRFHAILRNPYWQNVVRFFAGCADAGELDMVMQELRDLQDDEQFKYTYYPRVITAQILSDYVFTQKPKKMVDVVRIIVDGINVRSIMNQSEGALSGERLILPKECGRVEVTKECFRQLSKFPPADYAAELIDIALRNDDNNIEQWNLILAELESEAAKTKWVDYAYRLQLIYRLDKEVLLALLDTRREADRTARLRAIINGNRFEIINGSTELKEFCLNQVLSHQIIPLQRGKMTSFQFLGLLLHPAAMHSVIQHSDVTSKFHEHLSRISDRSGPSDLIAFPIEDQIDRNIMDFAKSISTSLDRNTIDFKTSLEPYDNILEDARRFFGDQWAFCVLATIAAGIKTDEKPEAIYEDTTDSNLSIVKRARYARLRSGNSRFWGTQLSNSRDPKFSLLLFFTWATPKVIIGMLREAASHLRKLSRTDHLLVTDALSHTSRYSSFDEPNQALLEAELAEILDEEDLKYILALRFRRESGGEFVYKQISGKVTAGNKVDELKLNFLLRRFFSAPSKPELLRQIKEVYKRGGSYEHRFHFHSQYNIRIPIDTAKRIMSEGKMYPRIISALAERVCRNDATSNLIPIGKIAEQERWFEE